MNFGKSSRVSTEYALRTRKKPYTRAPVVSRRIPYRKLSTFGKIADPPTPTRWREKRPVFRPLSQIGWWGEWQGGDRDRRNISIVGEPVETEAKRNGSRRRPEHVRLPDRAGASCAADRRRCRAGARV